MIINEKMKKRAVVVKSEGIKYDDRVRKVSLALSKKYYVKIFIVQDDNSESSGKTKYGIDYESIKLPLRDKLPHGKFLMIKTLEYYFRVIGRIKDFDYYWYNEEKTFLFPLLAPKSQIFVWDQHEIPEKFCFGIMKYFFNIIEKKCKLMFHANPQRIEYLKSINLIKCPEKHRVIHNYPDEICISSESKAPCYDSFKAWLGNSEYVYLQGLNEPQRRPFNSISAILDNTNYKIFVAGYFDNNDKKRLEEKYPDLYERVFYAGLVPQLTIPSILKKSKFTIVLYETSTPNNKYCEANRMYQSMSLGVPIIVGENPSMAEVVDGIFGIALKSDGSDIEELNEAVKVMCQNMDKYKVNCLKHSRDYIWSENMVDTDWIQ